MSKKWKMFSIAGVVLALMIAVVISDTAISGGPAPVPNPPSPERQKVYDEITAAFGFVPGFFKTIPDISLAHEWNALKTVQMAPGAIPNKYRELIGLAVASVRGCDYCTYFHTEFARLNGATDAELEDAVHFAKSNAGWSTYLAGIQYDYNQFKKDVDDICNHVRTTQAAGK